MVSPVHILFQGASDTSISRNVVRIPKVPTNLVLIGDVLNYPSQLEPPQEYANKKYLIQCHIIDFRPSHLEDFCQATKNQEGEDTPTSPPDSDSEGEVPDKVLWQWNFDLVIMGEDQVPITVRVDDAAGNYLLNMNATK